MKALFIGGTGVISMEITRLLAADPAWELYLLNRGNRANLPAGVQLIQADIHDADDVERKLAGMRFDLAADFIAFTPADIERDLRLFRGRVGQYIFISSASAYQKPLSHYLITESTPLSNPFWQYSRDKIACEERLMRAYREEGFPATIVRPSHTYGEKALPVAFHGRKGSWQVLKRMLEGKPVIVPGDGSSLWTVTHAADFAKGFAGLMGNLHAVGEAVQITSDESLTWNQIHSVIGRALGVEPVVRHIATDFLAACRPELTDGLTGDKSHTVVFDNGKLKRLVPGFQAAIRFDQGAPQALSHILDTPALQQSDPAFDAWCDRVIELYDGALAAARQISYGTDEPV
ncbi:MAG: SDR family oxidoreductase [Clostridiales bacterium]|nr:SDR family oxidoreductase [Clostridiales bacterium]